MTAAISAGLPLRDVKVPYLMGVSMDAAGDGWAVGYDGHGGAGYALHDQNGVWTKEPLTVQTPDAGLTFTPLGEQMISATDGWIFGSIGQNITLPTHAAILHLTDGVWREKVLPAGLTALRAVSFVSASTGWALAYHFSITSTDTLILKYAAGHWSVEARIVGQTLTALSMATPSDGMALGDHGLYRYRAGARTPSVLPTSIPTSRLVGVAMASAKASAMASATEAWTLGFNSTAGQCQQECGDGTETVLAQYAKGAWTR